MWQEFNGAKYFLFFSFNCMDWHLLPPASDTLIAEVAVAAKGNFTGDPSYKYENTEIQHESQDDDAAEEKVTVSSSTTWNKYNLTV